MYQRIPVEMSSTCLKGATAVDEMRCMLIHAAAGYRPWHEPCITAAEHERIVPITVAMPNQIRSLRVDTEGDADRWHTFSSSTMTP
jgi:hypothetical protein